MMKISKLDKYLKIWFFVSVNLILIFSAWVLKLIIYKIGHDVKIYSDLIKFIPYIIFFSSIVILKFSKHITFFIFYFSIYVGFLLFDTNYKNINFKVETFIKSNSITFALIQSSKKIFKKNKKNVLDLSDIYLNKTFDKNILLRQDNFPDIYVANNEIKLKKILNKDNFSNALPLLIHKKEDGYILTYFDYSKLNKVSLDKNFEITEYFWKKKHQTVFHHWGDLYNNKIYILGSNTKSFPNDHQLLYKNNFKNCSDGWFLNETIEIIDYEDGSLIKRIEIMDKLSKIKEINNPNFNLICQDPSHSNDIRIIKDEKISEYFPDGKVGDILISVRHFNSIILLDKDSYEIKWYVVGKTEWQHSPKITSEGTIFVFDNLGSNPINGLSRIVSIDIKTKNIIGIYESSDFNDFFESESGGRLQFEDNIMYIIETNKAKMFSIECENLIYFENCRKVNIFENNTKSDLFFAHVF